MKANTEHTMEANRRLAKNIKFLQSARDTIVDSCAFALAWVLSLFNGKRKKKISTVKLQTKSQRDIVINCMGCVDLRGDTAQYLNHLRAIRGIMLDADISFASSRFGRRHTSQYATLRRNMRNYRIQDVSCDNPYIHSCIYQAAAGNVAVVSYMQNYSGASRRHNRLELVKEYYTLKRMGADYVILYIDSKRQRSVSESDKTLYQFLLKAGVDYIVGIKPEICDSGVTYGQKNGSVSRGVYSVGMFLSNTDKTPVSRAVIRLKLHRANGKLQAYEETYYPLRYNGKTGILKNLTAPSIQRDKADISVLATLEKCFPRIRPVDRVLTVGQIMRVIGAELPVEYDYLSNYSVGKVCARSFEASPGDVFFFREPFHDPNDLELEDPKHRLKLAKNAARRGATLLITFQKFPFKCRSVVCSNVIEAHIAVCAYLRKQFTAKTIGITGSVGKTSTKDMLAEVMKMRYKTVKSEQNTNVQVKIGMNLQRMSSDCEVFIQEIGGGRPGGASRHSRMILPDVTIITNIGDAHIGNFYGDQRALMRNKLEIIDGMPKDGTVFLNGDDPLLREAHPNCKRILFAINNKNADYYADNVVEKDNKISFDIVYGDRRVSAQVNVPGRHNVLNAVCSFAVGMHFGIPEKDMVRGIGNFKTQGIRQHMVQASGRKLFFDCFNASSGSMETSIKTLRQIVIPEHGRRIAMLGDVTGLGDLAEQTHRELAHILMANPADLFLFYGTNTRFTCETLKENGFEAYYTPDYAQLVTWLQEKTRPGDAIMAKGSSKMKLEYAFDCAFGTRSFDAAMIEEGAYCRVKMSNISYNLFSTHATAVRVDDELQTVKVREKVGSVLVHSLGTTFNSPNLVDVELPGTIRHIGVRSFENCTKLKRVTGMTGVKYIGLCAFKNCSSLQTLQLPDTLLHIGNQAFSGCTSLRELYIPGSVAQIGPGAFADCPQLSLRCEAGSYAEEYLKKNGLKYTCQ